MQIRFEKAAGNESFAGGFYARKVAPFIHLLIHRQLPGAIFTTSGLLSGLLNRSRLYALPRLQSSAVTEPTVTPGGTCLHLALQGK